MIMRAIELAARWAWETSVGALPLIAIALVGMVVLRRAAFTQVRWMLWVLVAVRLLMPWAPEGRMSVWRLVEWARVVGSSSVAPNAVVVGVSAVPVPHPSPLPRGEGEDRVSDLKRFSVTREQRAGVWHNVRSANVATLLASVWFAGVLAKIGKVVGQQVKVRKWVRGGRAILDGGAWETLEDVKRISRVGRKIRLVAVEQISSPALFGFWKPVILLPAGMAGGNEERLRLVLLHEVAHVKRWDVLVKWVMILARALHWFNPLAWVAMHRLTAEQELLCDGDVLRLVSAEERRGYAETLLALASGAGAAPAGMISISANFKQLKERIGMIQQFKPGTQRWLMFLVPPLTAVVAIVTFTAAVKKPVPPQAATRTAPVEVSKDSEAAAEKERTEARVIALRMEYDRIRAQIEDRQHELESVRKQLKILPGVSSESGTVEPEIIRNLERERITAETDYVRLDRLYQGLKGMNRAQLRQAIPVAYKDEAIDRYLADYAKTEQNLTMMKKDYSDDHPEVVRLVALLKNVDAQIEARVDGVMSGLEVLVSSKRAILKSVEGSLEKEKQIQSDAMERNVPYFEGKRDLRTMQKMRDSLYMQLMEAEVNSRMPAK